MPKTPFEASKNASRPQRLNNNGTRPSFRKRGLVVPEWDNVPEMLIAALVRLSTTQGASPTFGYTKDGTSLTIAIYHKGDRKVDYLSGPEEVQEYLTWLATEYFALGDDVLAEYDLGGPETA